MSLFGEPSKEGSYADLLIKSKEVLSEAQLQIKYLHKKFQETGTGNSVCARLESLIEELEKHGF